MVLRISAYPPRNAPPVKHPRDTGDVLAVLGAAGPSLRMTRWIGIAGLLVVQIKARLRIECDGGSGAGSFQAGAAVRRRLQLLPAVGGAVEGDDGGGD